MHLRVKRSYPTGHSFQSTHLCAYTFFARGYGGHFCDLFASIFSRLPVSKIHFSPMSFIFLSQASAQSSSFIVQQLSQGRNLLQNSVPLFYIVTLKLWRYR